MEYSDNYPNGYKSGYSSADDPDREKDYSSAGVEAQRRDALAESAKREREGRQKTSEEIARQEYHRIAKAVEGQRMAAIDADRQRAMAVNLIVQQAREKYQNLSWFRKAVKKLRRDTFAHKKSQIEENAIRRVENMTPGQLTHLIEEMSEQKGRVK